MGATGDDEGLTVGELAHASGLTVRTLHHYDRLELLVPSYRTTGGHRRYSPDDVAALYRIVTLRQLGLSLSDIAALVSEEKPKPLAETLRRQLDDTARSIADQQELLSRLKRGLAVVESQTAPSRDELLALIADTVRALPTTAASDMYRPPDASAAAILASVFEGVTASHHQLRHLMERLTERQLHLAPTPRPDEPGSGSPVRYGGGGSVGSLLIHAVVFEDDYVNRAIRNQRPMWEQPALADAAGAGELSRYRSCPSKPVAELPPATFRIEPFRCYAEAVFAATFAYVEDIADEELNRRIPGPGRTALTWSMTVSELLIQVAAHAFSHAAEITTLANLRQ